MEASENTADRFAGHTAQREQTGIIKAPAGGKDIPEVHGPDEAGFFDEFFYFPYPSTLYLCLQKNDKIKE